MTSLLETYSRRIQGRGLRDQRSESSGRRSHSLFVGKRITAVYHRMTKRARFPERIRGERPEQAASGVEKPHIVIPANTTCECNGMAIGRNSKIIDIVI